MIMGLICPGSMKVLKPMLLQSSPLAVFSPRGCHSLNLCGSHAAECCPQVQTFIGMVQKLYNLFSSSPMR